MMTKDGLIFEANSLKQGRLQALTRQQLQAQATQNRERRWVPPPLCQLHKIDLSQAVEKTAWRKHWSRKRTVR